jgi:hypothetical protein
MSSLYRKDNMSWFNFMDQSNRLRLTSRNINLIVFLDLTWIIHEFRLIDHKQSNILNKGG